jgi:hypothetical protein
MMEAILAVLGEWVSVALRREATDLVAGEYPPLKPYRAGLAASSGLDTVLLFLKTVGERAGDHDLLDYCASAEVQLSSPEGVAEAVRQFCIHHFFHQPKFRVDMSKYLALMEEHKALIDDPEELRKLYGYVDEELKLKQVYEAVKGRLCVPLYSASLMPEIPRPTFDHLKAAVDEEIAEVYRRADKHFAKRLGSLLPPSAPTTALPDR